MTNSDWMIIAAMLLAPVLAVQVQKFIEKISEDNKRKMRIFKALMSTRAAPLSPLHVESLNMIDIEFYKDKKITEAWKLLLDNFSNYPKDPKDKDYDTRLISSSEKSSELLVDLLYEMAKSLGYKFDKVLLKRGCYIPRGHGEIEFEQAFIRKGFADLFLGKRTLPISIVEKEANT